jgi:hypothetical protein
MSKRSRIVILIGAFGFIFKFTKIKNTHSSLFIYDEPIKLFHLFPFSIVLLLILNFNKIN